MGPLNITGVVGDLDVPVRCVGGSIPTHDVERLFARDGRLFGVAVRDADGRLGWLTRERLGAILRGWRESAGTRPMVSAVREHARIVPVVPSDTTVESAIDQLGDAGAPGAAQSLLVQHGDGRLGIVSATRLLEHVSSCYAHEAMHDALTGLPNRTLLADRMRHLWDHRARANSAVMLFVDLDGFKAVNDGHGHEVGDELLREVARRLAVIVREHDTVARIGGDEFVILLEDLEDPVVDAEVVAHRMLASMSEPFQTKTATIRIGASVGLTLMGHDAGRPEELLLRADTAMYAAKRHHTSTLVWWGGDVGVGMGDPQVVALRQALSDDAIEVWFQPKVHPRTGVVREVEALARWHDGTRWVPPVEFVALAEEHGLAGLLGCTVLRQASRVIADFNTRVDEPIILAVNVSRRQLLQTDLLIDVAGILAQTGLSPDQLRLEIDDTDLPPVLGRVGDMLFELTELGVRLTLGHFGAGVDSLLRLGELPVAEIKLNREFLDGLHIGRTSAVMRMVIAAAHELGVEVTAVGVETEAQAGALADVDIDLLQGFHSGRPMRDGLLAVYAASRNGDPPPLADVVPIRG